MASKPTTAAPATLHSIDTGCRVRRLKAVCMTGSSLVGLLQTIVQRVERKRLLYPKMLRGTLTPGSIACSLAA